MTNVGEKSREIFKRKRMKKNPFGKDGGKNNIKKQLVIIGIIAQLVTVGFSGCTETKEELTPANIILKDVTFEPSAPVENETIVFTVWLENTGDQDETSIIKLNGIDRNKANYTTQSNPFTINGHSQKNVTVSIEGNIIDEGWQSFDIGIVGPQTNYIFKLLQTIEIVIEPGAIDV
jgi:cellobiose-specific phosphotransferase system component IIB